MSEVIRPEDLDRIQHAHNKLKWHVPDDVRANGRYLDIGCGIGNGIIAALQHGASFCLGIDRDLEEFGQYRFDEYCKHLGLPVDRALILKGDISGISFGNPKFDYAMMLDVIEHVPNPPQFIQFAYDSLRQGGVFVLDTCPLYYSPVGSHLFKTFEEATHPWAHLYYDFEELVEKHKIHQWDMDRFHELSRVTHAQIVEAVKAAGFNITYEHKSAPTDARRELYASVKHRIDHSKLPDESLLYEDWILLICRK